MNCEKFCCKMWENVALSEAWTLSFWIRDLEPGIKQLEEEMTKAKSCRETIISNYRSQFTFPYDRYPAMESGSRDIILWKITSLRLVFDTAKYSIRLDDAAKDHSTHYNSPLFRTNHYGYFFGSFLPIWSGRCRWNPRLNYVRFLPRRLRWVIDLAVPKTIHLSVLDQLKPKIK